MPERPSIPTPSSAALRARPGLGARAVTLLGMAALLGLILAGCPGVWFMDDPALVRHERSGLHFNHRFHVEEQGLVCDDCHQTAGARPSEETCSVCHEPVGPEGPATDECRMCHTNADLSVSSDLPPIYADVIFEHQPHQAAGVTCDQCHGDMAAAEGGPYTLPSMIQCATCHENRQAPRTCETCHQDERRDRPPPSHGGAGWLREHGLEARSGLDRPEEFQASCFYCHLDLDCEVCHETQPPRDHTESWRVVAHGLAADMDRTRCMTCHEVETCERCHMIQPPRTHSGSWGSPSDRHCLTCHSPLMDSPECTTCHEETPSHDLAPQPPSWHIPSMNCRQCHLPGAATPPNLPHPDNGDDCNDCHF